MDLSGDDCALVAADIYMRRYDQPGESVPVLTINILKNSRIGLPGLRVLSTAADESGVASLCGIAKGQLEADFVPDVDDQRDDHLMGPLDCSVIAADLKLKHSHMAESVKSLILCNNDLFGGEDEHDSFGWKSLCGALRDVKHCITRIDGTQIGMLYDDVDADFTALVAIPQLVSLLLTAVSQPNSFTEAHRSEHRLNDDYTLDATDHILKLELTHVSQKDAVVVGSWICRQDVRSSLRSLDLSGAHSTSASQIFHERL